MSREMISDQDLSSIIGGTIIFSTDHTTCGKNTSDQYKVLNFDAAIQYIVDHRLEMTEKTMLNNMVAAGILTTL